MIGNIFSAGSRIAAGPVRQAAPLFFAVALFAATLSCSLDVATGPRSETQLVILQLTPTDVEANAGSIVEPSPAIRVKEMISGKPLVGATVEFRAGPGSGSVEKPFTTTDASGFASAGRWEVGPRPGDFTLTAVVAKARTSFHVQIKPDVPARLEFDATKVVGLTGEVIDGPGLVVTDRFRNPIPGLPVTFTVLAGGGALEAPTALTNREGRTTVGAWRLGPTAGENALIATAGQAESERLVAVALDPATTKRYTLDVIRYGTTVRSLPWLNVLASTLTISSFDRCVCRTQAGHYVIDVARSEPTAEPKRIAGEYAIEPPWLRPFGKEIKSITVVDSDGLEIEIERNTWDERWVETWIFRAEAL